MTEYKLYILGPGGMIASGEWFRADNDTEAASIALDRSKGHAMELWQGDRLVRRVIDPKEGSGA